MRRLDLKNYTFSVPDQKGILQFKTYDFQKTLEDILPHHGLGLSGPELMRAMGVVEKVKKAKGEVLLDENDYRLIIDTVQDSEDFKVGMRSS